MAEHDDFGLHRSLPSSTKEKNPKPMGFFGGDDRLISLPPNVLAEICDLPLPIQLKGGSLTATRFTRWVERNNHSKADAEE